MEEMVANSSLESRFRILCVSIGLNAQLLAHSFKHGLFMFNYL